MLKNLKHFWQIHLTVALCTAVATGVLTGALLVGDSVRGSLKALTLERLGTIEHALIADRFFAPALLQRQNMVPAILLNGVVVAPEKQTRVSKVNVLGVDSAFFQFWEDETVPRVTGPGGARQIVINEALHRELNVQVGDALLVNFPQVVDIHPEFLFGQRDASETIQSLRLTVSEIIPTQNAGRFSLWPHQSVPLNAFISLPFLQNALGQEGKVNALFTAEPMPISPSELAFTLDALGLKIREYETHFELQSEQYLIKPSLSDIALSVATELPVATENGIPVLPTLSYLANTIAANGKTIPYSTIVAMPIDEDAFGVTLADDEIILNTWAADELDVALGHGVDITYYRIGADEEYITETAHFRLKAITPMQGLAADQGIIPDFPGIHDTADISEWDSPFPIDYSRIRAQDEAYWDEYRATPKAFITLATGKRLWKNRFGDITSLRMKAAPATRAQFETALLEKIQPEQVGFQFLSLRADGLQAAAGTTDFGMLFSGLSILIIFSVAYLIDMLFRIGVEQRSREAGLLRAVGYPLAKIRLRFLSEAGILAGVGTLIGCVFAIGYAQLMLFGLKNWWLPAIGTPFVELHVRPASLLIGVLISLGVVLFSIQFTIFRLGKSPPASLLAGASDFAEAGPQPKTAAMIAKGKKVTRIFFISTFCLIILAVIMGDYLKNWGITKLWDDWLDNPISKLLASAIGTIGVGWLAFETWLISQKVPKHFTRRRFAFKNAARHPAQSNGCVMMMSFACCIIVAVGVNRQEAPPQTPYAFVAEAVLPLHHNLNTEDGRFELGFSDKDSQLLSQSEVVPFRVLPGEDVSCLNLYQPQKPQILGISDALLDEEPWKKILWPGDAVIALADENSVRWVLHLEPEDNLVVKDEFGNPLSLHLHTMQNSLFQSQLIISESNFVKFFPSQSGYRYFLLKTPPELREATARVLEKTLGDYGFDVTSASARLASYRNVANTYISTFQSLGGLGVILGTFGLALVLFRNALERRGELATLRAFGFRRALLSRMLFLESTFLLAVGMLIGIAAGLVTPLAERGSLPAFPWVSLTITLLSIFIFGIIANAIAVAVALRSPLLATLKKEL